MKRIVIIGSIIGAFILGILILKFSPATSGFIWSASNGGIWLLPLVLASSLLDSVHPCSFSILLITIAFLFGLQMTRKKILQIGGVYIAGIFASYLLIGLGLLKVLHLFNTPHFGLPNQTTDLPQGGTITGLAFPARQIQFALKLIF